MEYLRMLGRERLAALMIGLSLTLILVTVVGVNLLDVKTKNIELIDRGLYNVITEKGSITIHSDDVLRIERTFTKAPLTGEPVELDKIYTSKGFIYLSSQDSFAETGRGLINSVDYYGLSTWEKPNTDWQTVKPYSYLIGTPKSHTPILFFLLTIQYIALSLGAFALLIFVFPYRFGEDQLFEKKAISLQEEYISEEKITAVAK